MNQYIKHKCYHITVPGHIQYNVPAFDRYFYCNEVGANGVEHTHYGLLLTEPISKPELLEYIMDVNDLDFDQTDKVHIQTHPNFNNIINYHYGLGDKPPCNPPPIWISEDFNFRDYLFAVSCKKSTNQARATMNQVYLNEDSNELVEKGVISIFRKK